MLASPVAMSTDESFTSTTSSSSSSSTGCLQDEATPFTVMLKTEGEVCFGCGQVITERYLLKVSGRAWHVQCLRCSVCDSTLDRQNSCYIKGDNIYCKTDYNREFGTKCSKCCRSIQSSDWVRRAKDNVYHLACFACDSCKRQLSTGEEFALQDDRLLCKTHYIETVEGGPNEDDSASQKQKAKRIRTTFSEEQLQVLQANFQLDSNPDGQDLERIAQITGLSKRVTQVWFQNSRARQKKHQTAQPVGKSVHQQHQQHQHDINNLNNVNTLNSINNMSVSMSLSTSLSSLNSSYSTSPPSDGAEFMLDCDSPGHADHLQRISPLVITPLTTAVVDRDGRHAGATDTGPGYSTHFYDKSHPTALPAV